MLEERQIKDVNMTKMLNYTHWVDHSMTDFPGMSIFSYIIKIITVQNYIYIFVNFRTT